MREDHAQEPLEVEVKFHLRRPRRIERRIRALGARVRPETFEHNIRYEDARGSLRPRGCMLRLRRDDGSRLTFKSPPSSIGENEGQFKVMRELEVTVSDFDTTRQILQALGFRAVQVYEKKRRTFLLRECHLCLDRLPFGDFLEIEGPGARIRELAAALELEWHRRILHNYLSIFARIRRHLGLDFTDVTFENFRTTTVDPELCRRLSAHGG